MSDAVLRIIDKGGKIGVEGVIALLQKPEAEFGAGLDQFRAEWIGDMCRADGLEGIKAWFDRAPIIRSRLCMMMALEKAVMSDGRTKWDQLIDMPQSPDNTWQVGMRLDMAQALDDLGLVVREMGRD